MHVMTAAVPPDADDPIVEAQDPLAAFRAFGLGKRVLRGVEVAGYLMPTPIQASSIPAILAGRDLLGLAKTGTGKTAAFALPLIDRLMEPGPGPRVLVIAPTRELVTQIQTEFDALGQFTRVRAMAMFGGVSQKPQERELKSRPPVLVAAPGRLLDFVKQGLLDLSFVEALVLDEADHMFDMGFLPYIRKIIEALPPKRQNLLFSATMPTELRALTDSVLVDPVVVELDDAAPIETIEHELYPVNATRKNELLDLLISARDFRSAIIFCASKERAQRVADRLAKRGVKATALQGNMSQSQRDRAMTGFRNGTYKIMVATDIAARGLDIAKVSHVINFDVPNSPEVYLHRIGRTGRAEQQGRAYTFVCPVDFGTIKSIEKKLGSPIPRRKVKDFNVADRTQLAKDKGGFKSKSGGRIYVKGFGGNRPGGGRKPKVSRGARRRPGSK